MGRKAAGRRSGGSSDRAGRAEGGVTEQAGSFQFQTQIVLTPTG